MREEVKSLKKSGADSQQQLVDKIVKRSGQQLNDVMRRESKSRAEATSAEARAVAEQAMAQEMKRVAPMASQELAKVRRSFWR